MSAITKQIITIETAVLYLPHILAAITIPLSAATSLKPLIINSLAITIRTIHVGSLSSSIKHIKAEQTKSLSASGSINFPKFVIRLYFLAILPSSKSVSDAIIKIESAIHLSYPVMSIIRNTTKTGTRITLRIVSLLGRFIYYHSYQIIFIGISNSNLNKITTHKTSFSFDKNKTVHCRGIHICSRNIHIIVRNLSFNKGINFL